MELLFKRLAWGDPLVTEERDRINRFCVWGPIVWPR